MVPVNDSLPSSPDPLIVATNPATNEPIGPNSMQRITPKKPVAASNGNIRLQNLCLTTPPAVLTQDSCSARAIALAEHPASPWRIHITVEAKKDQDGEYRNISSLSPTRRMAGRSTTTTIPLKGGNDSSPLLPKRGRGRPRKTLTAPTKRTGTPKPTRSTPKKAHRNCEKETPDHVILPNKISSKTKGRPRKSMRLGQELGDVERTETVKSRLETNVPTTHKIGLGGTTPREIVRGRRRVTRSPANVALKADGSVGTKNAQVSYSSSMNVIRPSGSVDSEDASSEERTYGSSNISSLVPRITENLPDSPQQSPGSAELAGWQLECSRQPKHLTDDHGVVDIALDPTHENQEFDSIMESEDFTMISISTLPSAQHQPSHSQERPKEDQGTTSTCQQPKPGRSPGAGGSMREDGPEMHHSARSSPETRLRPRPRPTKPEDWSGTLNPFSSSFPCRNPTDLDAMIKQKHPSHLLSSPALSIPSQLSRQEPSPERSLHQSSDTSSRLPRAVSRGIAARGVLEVLDNYESSNFPIPRAQSSVALDSPMQRPGDSNSGFGRGTKRELRAGLRLGEELAKEQRLTIHAAIEDYKTPGAGFRNVAVSNEASILPTPEDAGTRMLTPQLVEQRVDYPMLPMESPVKQFPIYEGSERHEEEMVNRNADPASELISYSRLGNEASIVTGQNDVEDTMLAREAQWQREREATSRQIQEANTSQIIVIESDDSGAEENIAKSVEKNDDEDEEEMDVWQAEARYPLHGKSKTPIKVFGGLCAEVPQEPRRSKLLSPWQRHCKTIYSGQTVDVDDQHELLWRPVLKHPRTPVESLMRKKAKYDDSTYSVLSDCIGQADSNRPVSVEHQAKSSSDEVGMNVGAPEQVEEDNNGDEDVELCEPSPSAIIAEYSQPAKTSKVDSSALGRCIGQESAIRPSRVSAQRTAVPTSVPPSSWFALLSNTVPYLHALIQGVGSAVADTKETFTEISMIPGGVPVPEPLSIYLPWKTVHYRRLRTVYLRAKRDHQLYPSNPRSSATWLLGRDVESMGWKKRISEWEVGVVDAFLEILATEGVDNEQVAPLRKSLKPIDAAEVAKRIFSLWCAEVQRGKAPLGKAVAGIFDKRYEWRRTAVLQDAAERGEP